MNSEQITKITADLAVATKLLTQVVEQLATNSCSLNGLEIAGINEHDLAYLKSELDNPENQKFVPVPAEDMGLVKNLDILPPVEIREALKYVGDEMKSSSELIGKSLKNISNEKVELSDYDIWEIALAEGIKFDEAMHWFKETFEIEGDFKVDAKKLILAYTCEYLRHKK